MKYGMRERVSGIIIVIALLVIFVPFLISDPESRESQPQPSLNIERPVDVPRQDVADPVPPARLEISADDAGSASAEASGDTSSEAVKPQDPIARVAQQAESRAASGNSAAVAQGDWAVQVGSFGKPDNASGLARRLKQKGYPVYSRNPGDGMTRVYVGPYATTEAAEGAMAQLKAELNQQGLLVRTDK
ncbi:SPOR domain-containing protein [Halomonas halocynthiae]|uniref:SPOR domain-containing protein n=1 Tax=Halomonas halocynthiae TaxID=176290 RepID=UPI00041F028A|nr:SPOR domain-containing protein [Halomonas halocynthiae]